MEGHILACSSTSEELFVLTPDIDEVKKVSITNLTGFSAEPFSKPLHVSVLDDLCNCVTDCGEILFYQISLKK